MPDLGQVGTDVFAGIRNGLLFEIYMSPVYAYKAAKHVEPSNLSLCCNGTVDIVLRAKNTKSLTVGGWPSTRIVSPSSDGFRKQWTSHVAFGHLPESLTTL
jgi:hypothetical protein